MKNSSDLPYIDNYPIDISIWIYPNGDEYEAVIQVNGEKPQSFHIRQTLHDIEVLNSNLQQTIEYVSEKCKEDGVSDEVLLQLASAGKSAFNEIFASDVSRKAIQETLSRVSKMKKVTLEISSKKFCVPWEMLYCGSLGESVDIYNFWGMRYIISRTLIQEYRSGDMVSPIIDTSYPQVGLVTNKKLNHVLNKEIPALKVLKRQKQIRLSILPNLNTNRRQEDLKKFGHFMSRNMHIAHFACHAYVEDIHNKSCLSVSDSFDITIEDFQGWEFKSRYNPLVILNACRTGTISPLYTSNWATLFWEYGARGVLATEFRVPDWFAAEFIEELYKHFLSGIPIGESLFETRCHFWRLKNNPLGLAYALYSPLAIRIVNSS